VVVIGFDARVVVRNLRSLLALATEVGEPGRDHHCGVVFTDRHRVW